MKLLFLLLLSLCALLPATAQTEWHDPAKEEVPAIQGRAWNAEIGNCYHRLPGRAESAVGRGAWAQSLQSAGLSVRFYTNAGCITVRYRTKGYRAMQHMPATGVSGVDLYTTDCHGATAWCSGKVSFGDTITYRYENLSYHNIHDLGNAYCLYLPLYNEVDFLEIGVPAGAYFAFAPLPAEKPVVVYGTSIAQGACASRPGMAWANIVQRRLDVPVVNLGFSGCGLLEAGVFDLMAEIDARAFVVDCMPNMVDGRVKDIRPRLKEGIARIRRASAAPILLVGHNGYMGGGASDSARARFERCEEELAAAFSELKESVEGVYLLPHEELRLGMDHQVDGVHPSDLGMQQYADAYVHKLKPLLRLDAGGEAPFYPCRQRREPHSYEWDARHNAIIGQVHAQRPEVLLIGNSITHFWGGLPAGNRRTGAKVWDRLFRRHKAVNLGCGWDRIENVLWRINHGELEGTEARKVFLMIGTNNLDSDSDEDISRGICQVAAAIKVHQPGAEVFVWGILPRRGREERVARINELTRARVQADASLHWLDASPLMTQADGKIKRELFTDGLHPNERGYEVLAGLMKEALDE